MRRRRFLQIAAAAAFGPSVARAEARWSGIAMGAEVEVQLRGPGAGQALDGLPSLLNRLEAVFSLYRPSELVAVNAAGGGAVSGWMAEVLALSDQVHHATAGAFDPTVQPLWRALAEGGDVAAARGLVGWGRVRLGAPLRLGPGQQLTFNGIAQGFAADVVAAHLAARGFDEALVNMGEYAAIGGPYRLGIADPAAGILAEWHVTGGAVAASSPMATRVGGQAHIQHPRGLPPLWSTVAVEAGQAALADALSTALVFHDRAAVQAIAERLPGVRRVALVDWQGGLETIRP